MGSSGWLLAGCGWLLAGCECLWVVVGGCGFLWVVVGGCWQLPGDCGWLLAGCGWLRVLVYLLKISIFTSAKKLLKSIIPTGTI